MSLRHPRLVKLLAVCENVPASRGLVALIFEYMEFGSLDSVIRDAALGGGVLVMTDSQKLRILVDVADGFKFVHSKRCVHRDIKPANILVGKDFTCKVSDFGLSGFRDISNAFHTRIEGTIAYSAPETFGDEEVTNKVDVYGFGVLIWELVTSQKPWANLSANAIMGKLCIKKEHLPITSDIPDELAEVIRSCLSYEPSERPSFSELFEKLTTLLRAELRREHVVLSRVPEKYLCPITHEIMKDPVVCADGYTYSKAALVEHLASSETSPITQEQLTHRELCPNRVMLEEILALGLPDDVYEDDFSPIDAFISYRVEADGKNAIRLYHALTKEGMKVFLDKFSLRIGKRWQKDFVVGLRHSSILICLMSLNAINHPSNIRSSFPLLTETSHCDNMLLEHRLGLDFEKKNIIKEIIPVLIGKESSMSSSSSSSSSNDIIYSDFFTDGSNPVSTVPDVVVRSLEVAFVEYLREFNLAPSESEKTVKSIYNDLMAFNGISMKGQDEKAFKEVVDKIVQVWKSKLPSTLDNSISRSISSIAVDVQSVATSSLSTIQGESASSPISLLSTVRS